MHCDRYTPYLAGFAGNDLRADTARIVGAHLEQCARCRDEALRQQHVVGSLRAMQATTVRVPAGLAEDVIATVRSHQQLGGIAAAVPLAVADRMRRVVGDPRVRGAAEQVASASRQVAGRLADPKAKAAAAAGTAAVAGGIVAIVSRRRRIARTTATA